MFWNVVVLGTVGLVVLLIGLFVWASLRPGPLPGELSAPANFPDEGRGQVPVGSALTFLHYPPSSGTHYDQGLPWSTRGSDLTQPLEEGYYLNNLARGGVVFLYECSDEEACTTLVNQFQELLRQAVPERQFNQVKILVGRYGRPLETPIVALAWKHQLNLPAFDQATLQRWYQRFVNQGPIQAP
jgi:hypothetical protein